MSDGIMIASDCADWWDVQLKNYHEELEAYVMENPGYWGITVATAKATAADFSHMFFVDLIRLGEGVAQGGVKGVAQDVFRVMQFIPQGKLTKLAKPLKTGARPLLGAGVQRVSNWLRWSKVKGELCVPITIAQAMQRTGQKFAVSLKGIAEALDLPLERIYKNGIPSLDIVAKALEKLGVHFDRVPPRILADFTDVLARAQTAEGPIMVAIRSAKGNKHVVLVAKTSSGIKIIDRAGIFNSLDDLARAYKKGAFDVMTDQPVYIFKNAVVDDRLLALVTQFGAFACLARISIGVFDFNRSRATPEFVKTDFQRFAAARKANAANGGRNTPATGKHVNVEGGNPSRSTLSGIAQAELGSMDLWPLIYDLNRPEIGPNPNLLRPKLHGHQLRLFVLPRSAYTPQQIAEAKKRASTWKNYPLPAAAK